MWAWEKKNTQYFECVVKWLAQDRLKARRAKFNTQTRTHTHQHSHIQFYGCSKITIDISSIIIQRKWMYARDSKSSQMQSTRTDQTKTFICNLLSVNLSAIFRALVHCTWIHFWPAHHWHTNERQPYKKKKKKKSTHKNLSDTMAWWKWESMK